jgi:cytochrome c biogenesis factor
MKFILPLLLSPNIVFARGNLFDIGGLFYIALGIGLFVAMYYILFVMPTSFINKSNKKNLANALGSKVWVTFLYTFFIPLILVSLLGISNIFALGFICILWLFLINFFYTKNDVIKEHVNFHTAQNSLNTRKIDKSNYEWELTNAGLINLKTGHLIPKSFLRQTDNPEPGCFIDNYIFHTEFIPEDKIKITNSQHEI